MEERRKRAVQLRLAGATFTQIAEQAGYSDKSKAWHAVNEALQRIGAEEADELRTTDLARLDRLLMAVWPQAMQGDVQAVDRVLTIIQRRARMLGYEQPNVVNIRSEHGVGSADGPSFSDVLGSASEHAEQDFARLIHQHLTAVDTSGARVIEGPAGA